MKRMIEVEPVPGRVVLRSQEARPITERTQVPDAPRFRRAIARGDLRLVEPKAAAEPKAKKSGGEQ